MNKKGLAMFIWITIGFALFASMLWYVALSSGRLGSVIPIGMDQAMLLHTYQDVEEDLLALDVAAAQATRDSLVDMYSPSDSDCGTYGGYAVWSDGVHECMPTSEDLNSDFEVYFNRNLDFALRDYSFPSNNYVVKRRQEGNVVVVLASSKQDYAVPLTLSNFYVAHQENTCSGVHCIQSPNYDTLYNRPITHIVIHASRELNLQDSVDRLTQTGGMGAHYVIDRDGTIVHMIEDENIAHHIDCNLHACEPADLTTRSIAIVLVNLVDRCGQSTSCRESRACETDACQEFYSGSSTIKLESYSPIQLQALQQLILQLMEEHSSIPSDALTVVTAENMDKTVINIGPAFDLETLQKNVRDSQ